jgi:CRP-like cAMP-binding protein
MIRPLESRLALLPYFRDLRPDERVRIAARFTPLTLQAGESWQPESPRLVLLVEGEARLLRDGASLPLFGGDSFGEVELATGQTTGRLEAVTPLELALLDGEALEKIFADYPATAPAWLQLLGRELKWRNDVLRELSLAFAENLPPAQLESMLSRRRRRLQQYRQSHVRGALLRLGRALFMVPGSRPSFWVLVGALAALAAARTVVALIIANGLQKHLFALIGGKVGHPIHVHHFNYGLLLVSLVSLLLLLPRPRSALKRLAFVFGFGLGLIVDEFALLWNLNPDYYQPQSRFAAGLVIVTILQVVYLRNWWGSIFRRVVSLVRG